MSLPRLFAALAAVILAVGSCIAADAPKPLKILLVCGGCCHDYQAQKNILQTGLEERAHVEVTVVHQGGSRTDSKIELYEKEDWAKGYDLVIHDECFADVKEKGWVDQILKPHREGLPGVVIHCAMHCYRTGADDWFEFCGVTSRRHGAAYAHEVLNRDAEHPIMKNFGAAWANPAGELYWIEKVWDTAHPLAAAKNREKGNEEVCVWTNTYREKTRVFGTTLGHHNETVRSPEFLDMLTRGVLWACDKLEAEYLKERKPKQEPVNLCLGKKAKASSEESNKSNFAANAIDGKADTRWCASSDAKNEWLEIDLGKPEKLTGCRLVWEGDNAVYKYKVEGSPDGKEWKTLVDGTRNEQQGTNAHKFEAEGIQHVRVTYLGSSTGSWGSLWEVEVFGTELRTVSASAPQREEDRRLLAEVKVPAGFEATLFAAPPAVVYPVSVAAAPDGTLYVAVDKNGSLDRKPNHGAIYRLRDLDGDGRADETKLFVANVDSPRGLVWDHDRLYVMHPPHVSAFIDRDGDGIAEDQQVLVKNIAFTFKDRPADHTSNGVTLGIDGWLYLAIGDFGFMEAEGTDGRKLQLRGGGVVRVRPDGTGLELYSRGTRNILEVALDPLLNGFSRDNTNDGGGWDIRLHHYTGLEDHGYPRLYMNFGDEIVQPLADYGGGSGCGGLYLDEPGFPAGYGNALYTCDWGRNWVYRHNLKAKGATFEADQHEAFGVTRVTDLDVDANSHLYVASWKGATFNYVGDNVGYIARISPKGFTPPVLIDFARPSEAQLLAELCSPSHRRRLEAQRALVRRGPSPDAVAGLENLAADGDASLASRVAAVFALKLSLGKEATPRLVKLAADASIREYAIRALADRLEENEGVPNEPILSALQDENLRTRLAALVALARLGRVENAMAMTTLLGDADPVVAHTAVQALVALEASDACLAVAELGKVAPDVRRGALRVLQSLHSEQVAAQVIERLAKESDPARRLEWFTVLCRLNFREGEWKGDSWGTRPDTSGPYYQPVRWSASEQIEAALSAALAKANSDTAAGMLVQLSRHKVQLPGAVEHIAALAAERESLRPILVEETLRTGKTPASAVGPLLAAGEQPSATPALRAKVVKALKQAGSDQANAAAERIAAIDAPKTTPVATASAGPLVESMPVEEAVAAVLKTKGDVSRGAQLFTQLECVKCHTVKSDEPPKGPFLGTIANTYKRRELTEAILLPSKTLAQGFVTNQIVTDDGKQVIGFVVQEAADRLTLRNVEGKEIVIPVESIEERTKLTISVMPDGLVKKIAITDLASLVDYLESLPKK
jgi:putative membrane-bound dehydrogenase-like protein